MNEPETVAEVEPNVTETGQPELTEAQLMQLEISAMFERPIRIPLRWGFLPLDLGDDGPGVLIEIETPAYKARMVMTRDDALRFSSNLKRTVHTGPSLAVVEGGRVREA